MSRPQPRRDAGPSARQAPRRRASASEAPVNAGPAAHRPPDLVELGVITGAHALRGEVRVQWYGDGPENLARVAEVWLARDPADPAPRHFEVRACGSGRAGDVRLALRGVSDRESAEALRGETVLGLAASLAPLPEGEFYWHELVGCDVVDQEGSPIGVVKELWETGAHDLLVVEGRDGARYLLSTARELMPEVDVAAGRIVARILPGMLDDPIRED